MLFLLRIARALLLIAHFCGLWQVVGMSDWALNYILHVLDQKDWSANRLAKEAGVASSTINRPLREKDWAHKISRSTIDKIYSASGIDPAPFAQVGFSEESAEFSRKRLETTAERTLRDLDGQDSTKPNAQPRNEIKIAVVGDLAQVVATIDKEGIAKLRIKLDAIEAMLDD